MRPLSGRYRLVIPVILITLSALLTYSNTFTSPFHFDDVSQIVEYQRIRDLSKFSDFEGVRYIGELSFALNYHFGGLNVFGYHLVNIVIHIINGILVWLLVILTFKSPKMGWVSGSPHPVGLIALAASLLFVVHPIQTQAVTYIVQRYTSLATLFYLLSIVLFVKWRLQSVESGARLRWLFYFLSILSAVLAMKTKEISITLPFVIILIEFFFFGGRGRRAFFLLPYLLTLAIIPLVFINLDTDKPIGYIVGEVREASQETESISRGDYLLTQFRVIVTYIRLLLLPINQNLDYDYPVYHSFFIPVVFLSFLFLVAVFGLAVFLYIRSRKSGNGYLLFSSFGIFWFFITLSVESSIIPIRDVIFEHRLYLPSVGIVIAFSSAVFYGTSYARERLGIKVSLLLAACILLLVTAFPLGIATYKRNLVWKDDIALWDDVVRKSPEKARPHNNLGLVYAESGQIEHAISEYKTTLRIDPDFSETRINLGIAYYKQGKIDEALTEYKIALIALKTTSYSAKIYNNMGNTYAQQGNLEEAYQSYIMALKLKPDYPEAHNNLGVTYNEQGLVDEAIHEYKAAINLNPDYADAHNNLGIAYAKLNQIDAAIEEFKEALRLKSNNAEMHYNLGNAYRIKGLSNAAIKEYEHALQLSPEFTPAKEVLESLTLKYGDGA